MYIVESEQITKDHSYFIPYLNKAGFGLSSGVSAELLIVVYSTVNSI